MRYRLVVRVYHLLNDCQLITDFTTSVLSYLCLSKRHNKPQIDSLVEDKLINENIHQVDHLAVSVTKTSYIAKNYFTLRLTNEVGLECLRLSFAVANL